MAPLFHLLLLSSCFYGALASPPLYEAGTHHFSTNTNPSDSSSSAFWLSENGTLTFGFKSLDLNQYLLCIWMTADSNRTPLWWPNITNPILSQGATLTFSRHGYLQLSDASQSILWNSSTTNASFARVLNSGNLQLVDETQENIVWQSFSDLRDTLIVRTRDESPADLLSDVVVDKPSLLRSRQNDSSYSPGRYYIFTDIYQNVYLHTVESTHNVDYIYMYAHMNGSEEEFFELSRDGGRTYRDNSSSPMSMLRLDPDGELRIYYWNTSHSAWNMIWQFIDDKCLIGSPCGPFGICKLNIDGSPNCTCPVGYQAVSSQSASLGCYSKFNLSSTCDGSESGPGNGSFHMEENEKSDYNYNDLFHDQVSDIEECKQLCLNDCKCIAASFKLHENVCYVKGNADTWILLNGVFTDNNTLLMKLPGLHHGSSGVSKRVVVEAVVIGVLVLIIVLVMLWWVTRKQGRGCGRMWPWRGYAYGPMMPDGGPIRFTYQQVVEATNNFSELLGEGGFGKVYKGRIIVVEKGVKAGKKQLSVAVKVLKGTEGAKDGEAEKQFRAEVSTLGKIHHINLVDLLGYCIKEQDSGKRILVYEFIENGSLAEHLSGEVKPLLSWEARYSIALGTARGIAYLHHDCKPHILHCDIKPQNVLLDHDFTPKVADFGFARRLEELKNHRSMSGVRGTRGYIAPEWLKTVAITPKADVYSYGMLLLELVRGIEGTRGKDGESLVDWAYNFIALTEGGEHKEPSISNRDEKSGPDSVESDKLGKIHEASISNLEEGLGDDKCVQPDKVREVHEKVRLLKAGLWCVQYQADSRPSMLRILQLIDGSGDDIGVPPSPPPRVILPAPKMLLLDGESSSISVEMKSYMTESNSNFSARIDTTT